MHSDSNFGKIEFVRNHRAKSIKVRILATGLKVTLPYNVSEQKAMDFIQAEQSQIKEKQERIRVKTKLSPIYLTDDSEVKTFTFTIRLQRANRPNISYELKDGILAIECPESLDVQSDQTQKHLWESMKYFLRHEAKRVLPYKTQTLANKHGFDYSALKIQSSKTRWGSCTGAGNINLSMFILLLPEHLIDYVILHELCHTKELNHSNKFWEWMDKVTDNKSNQYRLEMKNYNMPG